MNQSSDTELNQVKAERDEARKAFKSIYNSYNVLSRIKRDLERYLSAAQQTKTLKEEMIKIKFKKLEKKMTAERDQAIIDRDTANNNAAKAIVSHNQAIGEVREENTTLKKRIAALEKQIRVLSGAEESFTKKRKCWNNWLLH